MSSALKQQPEPDFCVDSTPANTIRVLLIDDDTAYSHLCKRFLTRDRSAKYDVVTVHDGTAGIELCTTRTFDCLLIDYSLPDLSGTEVINSLSELLGNNAPPAIILTADGGETAAAESVRVGATDFMPKKAVSGQSLTRAVDNAVEKGRLRRSVDSRSRELQLANEQLQLKNDEIQRFYQSVSHEVKTPLAATREFVAIVMDEIAGPVTDEQKEMLNHALDSCDQIASHFNDLVEMTRLDAAKVTLKTQLGSLDNVVTRCLASVAASVDAKNIYVRKEIESPLPLIRFDCNRVIQVLSNLLGNAIKYTGSAGTITLSISRDRDKHCIEIAVSDTGCGIEKDKLEKVFGRLYQVENIGDELMGAGLGLGLSIAKEIVTLHGGEIWATSEFGEGSTFAFNLPIAQSIYDLSEKQK